MTTLEEQYKNNDGFNHWQKRQRRGRVAAGMLVILAGAVYMAKQMGYAIPEWFFRWPTIVIAVGFITGVKHGFKDWKWVAIMSIGFLFLAGDIFPNFTIIQYKIPLILFLIGLFLIFKPKNKYHEYSKFGHKNRFGHNHRFGGIKGECGDKSEDCTEDYVFVNNVFAGTDKNIFSKDFKGGEIKNTFGGCKLNLMQAEIVTEATLSIKQHFGGVKLVIPPNWIIKSDIECVFAGIEDKRPLLNVNDAEQKKTLVLNGHIFMSGIEIVSY